MAHEASPRVTERKITEIRYIYIYIIYISCMLLSILYFLFDCNYDIVEKR